MVNSLLSEIGMKVSLSISVVITLGALFAMLAIIYDLVDNWGYYDMRRNELNKKIFFIFISFFVFILFITIPSAIYKMNSKKAIVKSAENNSINISDKFDFIEREFNRQVKHQLRDMNIILFLDDIYAGEYEDRFIELKGNEYGLDLKNVVFYDKKVIYEFIHKTNNN